jgi:hypothetical protein
MSKDWSEERFEMKTALYIMVLLAALVMVPMLSNVVMAQNEPGQNRELCLQNCSWLKPWGNNYGQYANYYNCVAGCESQFWSDFDRNTDRLERRLHEPD